MEQETKERMISAFEASCIKAGGNLDDGLALFARFADWVSTQAKLARDRETLSASLAQLPEPTAFERLILFGVLENLPALIRVIVRDAAEGVKELPPPPGGRERTFHPNKEREIRDYVSELHGEGYDKATAKRSAARKYKTSTWTVNRIWNARKDPEKRKPRFRQLLDFIRTGKI